MLPITKHPGEYIRELILKPEQLSVAKLSKLTGINRTQLNEVVNCDSNLTLKIAVKLAEYTKTSPQLWLKYQADYAKLYASPKVKRV